MKYKKEGRPKISHFLVSKRELIRLAKKKRKEEEEEEEEEGGAKKGKDFYDFW